MPSLSFFAWATRAESRKVSNISYSPSVSRARRALGKPVALQPRLPLVQRNLYSHLRLAGGEHRRQRYRHHQLMHATGEYRLKPEIRFQLAGILRHEVVLVVRRRDTRLQHLLRAFTARSHCGVDDTAFDAD